MFYLSQWASLVAQWYRIHQPMQETMQFDLLSQEDLLEKEMATHSSILAWEVPWLEEPGELQSMGSQRLGHDWATKQQQQRPMYRFVWSWPQSRYRTVPSQVYSSYLTN